MKTALIIFVFVLLSNIGFSQNLVPLDVNYNLKLEFEKVMIPQIEEKYYWHEKIIAFYEVQSNPIFKDFVNLAVKSEAGDIYYFAWVNVNIMPQLVTAVNSKRISEGVRLKMQIKAEKEYAIKIETRNTVIKNIDSLHVLYTSDLSSFISNEISYFENNLKDQISDEKSEFLFLDSINTFYRNKIDSLILSETNLFEDFLKKHLDTKFSDLYIKYSKLALDTFLSADREFEYEYSSLKAGVSDMYYEKLNPVIEKIQLIKNEQEKSEKIKFNQIEYEIICINKKIHSVNYMLITTKIRKKFKANLIILLESKFPNLDYYIEIIESYINAKITSPSVYIGELDSAMGITGNAYVDDDIYRIKKKQFEMYLFIENYLNEHKKS